MWQEGEVSEKDALEIGLVEGQQDACRNVGVKWGREHEPDVSRV
jgi:hypothetical protein